MSFLAAFHPTGTAAAGGPTINCARSARPNGVWVADASILLSIMALAPGVSDHLVEAC